MARRSPVRTKGVLLGTTRLVAADGTTQCCALDLLDLDAGAGAGADPGVPVRIALPFPGHGLALRPGRRGQAAVFEKRGRGACTVDLAARRVLRPIEPLPGHVFYGHGAYARTGEVLFAVETRLDGLEGALSVRDAASLRVLAALPTHGAAPHDCHLVEGGRTLAVTNGGGPADSAQMPSLVFIDAASGALLERHEFGDGRINAGHVALLIGREFAAVSAPRAGLPARAPGGVTLRRRGADPVAMRAPEALTANLAGEALSVAIHPRLRLVLATHPEADRLTFWSLDAGRLEAVLDLPQPRGVALTLDGRWFAVSYGADGRLLLIDAYRRRVLDGAHFTSGILAGAHLVTWAG